MLTPSSFETFSFDPTLGRVFLTEEIEGYMSQNGEVLSGMAGSNAAIILPKSNIQDPMHFVFNLPVTSDRLTERLGLTGQGRNIVTDFGTALLPHVPLGFHHANAA